VRDPDFPLLGERVGDSAQLLRLGVGQILALEHFEEDFLVVVLDFLAEVEDFLLLLDLSFLNCNS